jgi:DNA modification methylase
MLPTNEVLQGDALTVLKALPSESVNMVITSPPYWALRDYEIDGQLALEPTFELYVRRLCDIFARSPPGAQTGWHLLAESG